MLNHLSALYSTDFTLRAVTKRIMTLHSDEYTQHYDYEAVFLTH